MRMEVCSSIGENEGTPISGYGRKTAGMIWRLGHVIGNSDRCISTGTVFSKAGSRNETKGCDKPWVSQVSAAHLPEQEVGCLIRSQLARWSILGFWCCKFLRSPPLPYFFRSVSVLFLYCLLLKRILCNHYCVCVVHTRLHMHVHSSTIYMPEGNVELTKEARLAVWQAPGILLSPPPQHWNYKHSPPLPGFLQGLLGSNSDFHLLKKQTGYTREQMNKRNSIRRLVLWRNKAEHYQVWRLVCGWWWDNISS